MAKILAVEDEALVRAMVVETLESAGHTVLDAPDGPHPAAAQPPLDAEPPVEDLPRQVRTRIHDASPWDRTAPSLSRAPGRAFFDR